MLDDVDPISSSEEVPEETPAVESDSLPDSSVEDTESSAVELRDQEREDLISSLAAENSKVIPKEEEPEKPAEKPDEEVDQNAEKLDEEPEDKQDEKDEKPDEAPEKDEEKGDISHRANDRIQKLVKERNELQDQLMSHQKAEEVRKQHKISDEQWKAWQEVGNEIGSDPKKAAEKFYKMSVQLGYQVPEQVAPTLNTEKLTTLMDQLAEEGAIEATGLRELKRELERSEYIQPQVEQRQEQQQEHQEQQVNNHQQQGDQRLAELAQERTEILRTNANRLKEQYGDEWDKIQPDVQIELNKWDDDIPPSMLAKAIQQSVDRVVEIREIEARSKLKSGRQGLSKSNSPVPRSKPKTRAEEEEALVQSIIG